MDIHKIMIDSGTEITTAEHTEHTETATIPAFGEASRTSKIDFLVIDFNACIFSRCNQSFVSEREGRCYEMAFT